MPRMSEYMSLKGKVNGKFGLNCYSDVITAINCLSHFAGLMYRHNLYGRLWAFSEESFQSGALCCHPTPTLRSTVD